MSNINYYDTLGIQENSSDNEIKKAFRKLSMEYHPDRPNGGNAQKYKEINSAYNILSDQDKRKEYDIKRKFGGGGGFSMNMGGGGGDDMHDIFNMMFSGGFRGPQMRSRGGMGGPGINIEEIFEQFGGGGGGPNVRIFHNGRPVHMSSGRMKPKVIDKDVHISLEEAYSGCMKHVEIERWVQYNSTQKKEKETIYVDIKKGIDDGECIVVENKGHKINEEVIGNVNLKIHIQKHSVLERRGMSLYLKKKITYKQSICGFKFTINHIDGKQYSIHNQPGKVIFPKFMKEIPNLGMRRDNTVGSLIIEFDVEEPPMLPPHIVEYLSNNL